MTAVKDDRAPAPLKTRAVRGGVVTTVGQMVRLALQIGGIVVLARLLGPADYGLIAIALIPITFGEIFREFGLSAAAVQAPRLSQAQRNGLFWANTGLGVAMAVLAVLLAPVLGLVFDQPAVVGLSQALSLIFVFNGISAQYRASLTRSMRFVSVTGADIGAQVVGLAAGIAAALGGWGYWSLVVMQVGQAGLAALLLMVQGRWLPGLPRRGADIGEFWRYGRNLVGSQIVHYVGTNADTAILGYRLGPESLGLYDRAYRLSVVPLGQMRSAMATVALPVLSRVSNDTERFDRALLQGQVVLGYMLVPVMAVVAGASAPLVGLLLGEEWSQAGPLLGVLAAASGLQLLSFLGYWIYLSRALTHQLFQYTFVSVGVRVSGIVIGSHWGAIGVAVGLLVATMILWPISLTWLSRNTQMPLEALLRGALRILVLAAAAAGAAWAVTTFGDWGSDLLAVAVAALAAVAVYAAAAVVPTVRRDELVLLNTMRAAFHR